VPDRLQQPRKSHPSTNTTPCLNSPSVAPSTPTTAAALSLFDRGLWVIPAAGDDGKSVAGVVSGFRKWSRRPGREWVAGLFAKHTGCTIALLVGHCDLVVVDCDSDDALEIAEDRYGPSPILVRTPSGRGGHLYYKAPEFPVRQANLRKSDGLPIDIKAGKGAVVIVPQSVRPSTGVAYRFACGSWDDLPRLPVFRDARPHTDARNDRPLLVPGSINPRAATWSATAGRS
jgi:hypothetical protein